jgi:DNA repair protein RadC
VKILDIPKEGRPRERFLKSGPQSLSDAELIAIILRTGNRQENVIDMSNRLISEYGLDNIFNCSIAELQKIKGIGPSKAMQLLAISELSKRRSLAKNPIKKISCAGDVFNLYHDRLKDEKQEHFIVLILNNKNGIIKEEIISKGILDSAIIDPREVFKPAIRNSGSRVILVHNHPSGDSTPSQDDIEVTQKLKSAGDLIGINILDHVIIGKGEFWNYNKK